MENIKKMHRTKETELTAELILSCIQNRTLMYDFEGCDGSMGGYLCSIAIEKNISATEILPLIGREEQKMSFLLRFVDEIQFHLAEEKRKICILFGSWF